MQQDTLTRRMSLVKHNRGTLLRPAAADRSFSAVLRHVHCYCRNTLRPPWPGFWCSAIAACTSFSGNTLCGGAVFSTPLTCSSVCQTELPKIDSAFNVLLTKLMRTCSKTLSTLADSSGKPLPEETQL
jgi:hypothetical protein